MRVVKLGGSVLTVKREYRKADLAQVALSAVEVAKAPRPLALVHGAGGYGHVLAREHGLAHGRRGTPEQDAAFARVHGDVQDLNRLVVNALLAAGAPAVGFAPLDLTLLADGEVVRFDAEPVREAVERGLVPVLFGDVAFDRVRGFGIVSGDQVMVELCRALKPSLAVFASDVDGVFDRDPAAPGALVHPLVSARGASAGASAAPDVTGGMGGKVRRMGECAALGARTLLVNGRAPGRLLRALEGEAVPGTEVTP